MWNLNKKSVYFVKIIAKHTKEGANMQVIKKKGVGLSILAAMVMTTGGWALTLQEAMMETIRSNPKILETVKNYNAVKEDVKIAKSDWFPKLNYYGGVGYEGGKNTYNDYDWNNYSVFENSLILTQNVFDGWGTTHRIGTQQARLLASAYHYIETVNNTGFRLVRYYIDVLKNRELLKIAKENIRINEDIYNKVDKLYKGGLTTKSEMKKSASSLALARANFILQENRLKDALYQFKRVYGKEITDASVFENPSASLPLPNSYEEGRAYSLKHNPSILVQRYNIKAAQEGYEEKKSKYYPKFDLRARSSWNYNMGGIADGHDERYRVSGVMTYNLFNGLADKAAIQKGISQTQQAVMKEGDLSRQTEEAYNISWNAYTHLDQQLKYLQEFKKYSAQTLTLYTKEYEMGRRSLLDLLSAQNDLISAKMQIVNTKYEHLFAEYRILNAMGTMVPTVMGRKREYFARVALGSKDTGKADKLPVKALRENDRFLQSLGKNSANHR